MTTAERPRLRRSNAIRELTRSEVATDVLDKLQILSRQLSNPRSRCRIVWHPGGNEGVRC